MRAAVGAVACQTICCGGVASDGAVPPDDSAPEPRPGRPPRLGETTTNSVFILTRFSECVYLNLSWKVCGSLKKIIRKFEVYLSSINLMKPVCGLTIYEDAL